MTRPGNYCRGERMALLTGKGLTEDDVRAIRRAPGRLDEIGATFGISAPMVSYIKRRLSWAHVRDYPAGCVVGAAA